MKKFAKKFAIYLTAIISIVSVNFAILEVAHAANTPETPESLGILPKDNGQYQYLYPKDPSGNTSETASNTPYKNELAGYQNLTDKSYVEIIASLIRTMLYLVGTLTVIALVVVGVMYLTGSLSEDNISNAKKIFGYIAIGIMIISASYGIVAGILEINFF